jgi:hypothetical protein
MPKKEINFQVNMPESVYKLLPKPYARPSRVVWIQNAIRLYSILEREGVTVEQVMNFIKELKGR